MGQVTAAVDFGTSHTVAVVSGPGLPARLVTVDGHPWFPSAVFWTGRGEAVVGADALRLARTEPARLEPRPKSRVAEPDVLLGDAVVPTTALVRAVLARVVAEAFNTAGAPVQELVLTHPANWGSTRIGALLAAAQGLAPRLSTMSEPVAAAAWFAGHHDFPVGATLGVLDFGGGTCDAAVIRREPAGLTVAGCAGLPDLGGDDLDQRIVDWISADEPTLAGMLGDQQRLRPTQMAALLRFRDDVRAAKEVLSRHPQAEIALPEGLADKLLTRAEFERLVRADLARAVELLADVVTGCGLTPRDLLAIHLVGGSSQIPLLARMLAGATGTQVRLDETPQSVVALGGHALTVAGPDGQAADTTTPTTAPTTTPTAAAANAPTTGATPTGPVHTGQSAEDRAAAPVRAWRWAAAVVLTVVAVVVATTASLAGGRVVAGEALATGAAAERLTLPPPDEGDPIVVAGRSTQQLPAAQLGQPVQFRGRTSTMTWQLDSFVDTAEQSAELADTTVETDEAHRLILAKVTVVAQKKAAFAIDALSRTFVVDDRGLMIDGLVAANLPGCPKGDSAGRKLKPGQAQPGCLIFEVARSTPITEVALAIVSTDTPEAGTPDRLTIGARVPVSSQRVDGAPLPAPVDALPPGAAHTFTAEALPNATADVAAVDLVQNPSRYFDSEPIDLPGTRGVLLRLAVRMPEHADRPPPLEARLHDDRGTEIAADSAVVTGRDCTPDYELKGTDVQQMCYLFAVPTGTPVRDAEISMYGEDPTIWRLP